MELTAWVERTRSDRGVAGGDDSYAHGPGKITVPPDIQYFPSKVSWNLRYVQSQNIPEPGARLAIFFR